MNHPLDPAVAALSGLPLTYEAQTSRAEHIRGLCSQIRKVWPDLEPTTKAVEKWFAEGRPLPNRWRVLLTKLSELRGTPIALPEPDVIKEPTA